MVSGVVSVTCTVGPKVKLHEAKACGALSDPIDCVFVRSYGVSSLLQSGRLVVTSDPAPYQTLFP
jgi:hypothetical protein